MTTKGTKQPLKEKDALLQEREALRAKLAELDDKLETNEPVYVSDETKIQQDEYIPVMSLIPHNLNLSTKEAGQGNIKKFTRFGEVKRILYRDLLDIIEAHPNFMENGCFYILHPGFIRQNGLDDVYSKILTKEKIEKILSTNSEECVTLYSSANKKQQEIIVELLVGKLIKDPDSVNLNIVDRISRISKIDIVKIAEESKPKSEPETEEETE